MTLAEKFYRKFYKVKDEIKLSPEQWKVIRMMHECLRENNKPKLPKGAILVNRTELVSHLKYVNECLKNTDKLMLNPAYKDFSSGSGGSEMAKIWNGLNMTMQSIAHFELKIPLERINESEELN